MPLRFTLDAGLYRKELEGVAVARSSACAAQNLRRWKRDRPKVDSEHAARPESSGGSGTARAPDGCRMCWSGPNPFPHWICEAKSFVCSGRVRQLGHGSAAARDTAVLASWAHLLRGGDGQRRGPGSTVLYIHLAGGFRVSPVEACNSGLRW